MATLQQALTRIDAICPNAWDETAKLLWLNECESMIQTRILGTAPEQCITYDADTDRSTKLLVPAPFDRLYVYYVIAMCDYAAHETAHYADSMMLFNAALDEYAKWYQRTNGSVGSTPGLVSEIAANTKARHTHENKGVLDGITAGRTAAWDAKADKAAATAAAPGLMSKADKAKLDGIAAGATKVTVDSAVSASSVNPVQNKAIKQYVDSKAAESGAVRYDEAQTLTEQQKLQARKNAGALASEAPTITRGWMSICPDGSTDSNDAVHVTVTKAGGDNYTAALDGGPENWPVYVGGVATPTDSQTNYAATVAYVKAKIAEIGSGAALPSVTAADNGKILRVVSGAWAAASLPVYSGGVS